MRITHGSGFYGGEVNTSFLLALQLSDLKKLFHGEVGEENARLFSCLEYVYQTIIQKHMYIRPPLIVNVFPLV